MIAFEKKGYGSLIVQNEHSRSLSDEFNSMPKLGSKIGAN